jgi:hypothetical protein
VTAPGGKVGPLTQADLQAIWTGAVDVGYSAPLVAAGEGAGFEAYTQMFAQYARAAQAVDVSTQAMFILPSSGQSNPPASGAGYATVTLTMSRKGYMQFALALVAGQIVVGEVQKDWSQSGSVQVSTGRLYQLTQTLVFPPGDAGPYQVQAQAVNPGYGYNNPEGAWTDANGNAYPGTISQVQQLGTQYFHDQATVTVTPVGAPLAPMQPPLAPGVSAQATLTTVNQPDMFLPGHVGQYVLMTSGANAGQVGRATSFIAPVPPNKGSAVTVAYEQAVELTSPTGMFKQGETISFTSGGTTTATGIVLGSQPIGSHVRLVFELKTGTVAVGNLATGTNSAATGTTQTVLQATTWTPEAPPYPATVGSGACWRVLDWALDWQLNVGNAQQPAGGTSAMLDMLLADERDVPRATAEVDANYRLRGAAVIDVTSPNAIRRALTRSLGSYPWCFREVGWAALGLPGFFYDRTGDPAGDFYDTNVVLMTTTSTAYGLASFTITDPGAGYTSPPTVNLSGGGAGSANFPVLDASGRVVSITVNQAGTYTTPPTVTITGGGGVGCTVLAEIGAWNPPFIIGEPIEWVDANGLLVAKGLFGGYLPGTGTFVMVIRFRLPLRMTPATGDVVNGLTSGASWVPATATLPAPESAMRYQEMLDYASMRAYFVVCLQPSPAGEMGFCYDSYPLSHIGGFYDENTVQSNFYDGFPLGFRQLARQAWNAVERVRAGGVGWSLLLDGGPCP